MQDYIISEIPIVKILFQYFLSSYVFWLIGLGHMNLNLSNFTKLAQDTRLMVQLELPTTYEYTTQYINCILPYHYSILISSIILSGFFISSNIIKKTNIHIIGK